MACTGQRKPIFTDEMRAPIERCQMKTVLLTALAAVVLFACAGGAFADELWNPHLRGIDEGCPSALLPPKGVYFVNNSYFGSMAYYDGSGHATPTRLDLYVDVPILLYNPGYKLLHANYAVAIAQPFDYTSVYSRSEATIGNGHWGDYNTVVVPAILSWQLPHDFWLKASLAAYLDDPTSSPAHPLSNGGAGSGNSYWTLEPEVAVTYLHDGWNASADFKYDHNYKDTATGYQSGDQFAADYTISKCVKKWTFGVGGYQENQLQQDKSKGAAVPDSIRLTYGAGPIVGYNFGPVEVVGILNYNIATHNDFGGNTANVRVVMPL